MHNESTPKYEVAVEHLDWALQAFLSGTGYYAALHLAGAAEEVLAVCLRSPEYCLEPAANSLASLTVYISEPTTQQEKTQLRKSAMDIMNGPLNSVKHKRGHLDDVVTFDPVQEAADAIDRAVDNYMLLSHKLPLRELPDIEKFQLARQAKRAADRSSHEQ
jgi:hypothetical protein